MELVRALRYVSLAEATSFLILLAAMLPKYLGDAEQGVQVMGPIHGTLFILYVLLVVAARGKLGWDLRRTVLALGAGVLPVAPYLVEYYWIRPVERAMNAEQSALD